ISPPIVARGLVSPGDTFRAMREATSQVVARRAPRAGAGRPTSHTGPGPSGTPDAPAGPGARRGRRQMKGISVAQSSCGGSVEVRCACEKSSIASSTTSHRTQFQPASRLTSTVWPCASQPGPEAETTTGPVAETRPYRSAAANVVSAVSGSGAPDSVAATAPKPLKRTTPGTATDWKSAWVTPTEGSETVSGQARASLSHSSLETGSSTASRSASSSGRDSSTVPSSAITATGPTSQAGLTSVRPGRGPACREALTDASRLASRSGYVVTAATLSGFRTPTAAATAGGLPGPGSW